MSVKIKVLVEHYILVALASATALYTAGNHNLKTVAISAVTGVIGIIWASVKAKYLSVKEVNALVAGAKAEVPYTVRPDANTATAATPPAKS